jgi:alpha-N-arabinofuranosidase
MRLIDSEIELVACGSSNSSMPTFGEWESTVLDLCYDTVDYISLHAYYEEKDTDPLTFLASAVNMDHFIESVISTADAVRARRRHKKRINLSFDEWNVWYIHRFSGDGPKPSTVEWVPNPPLIEDEYSITDAVVVGTCLNSLLRHGDRVTVANQAQLVNVIGLLRSDKCGDAWKQTIAYPFEQMRRLAQGQIVRVVASGDKFDSPTYTDVPVIDASATYDEQRGRAALFVANRSLDESSGLEVDVRGVGVTSVLKATTLHAGPGQDRHITNSEDHGAITPQPFDDHRLESGRLRANLPPLSWTVFDLACGGSGQPTKC